MPDPTSGNDAHAHQFQEHYQQSLKALIEAIAAALKKAAQQDVKVANKAEKALKSQSPAGKPMEPLENEAAVKQRSLNTNKYSQNTAASFSRTGNPGKANRTVDPPIRLFVGGKEVYSQVPGQEPTKNFITPEQFQKIKQTLEDPKTLKGAVEIKAGTERIFHAKSGELKLDKLGLAQPQAQSVKTAQTADNVLPPTPPNLVEEQLKADITSLKQTVEQQGQRIETLEKKLDALCQTLNSVQNKSLSRWMGSTLDKTTQGFKQAVSGWAARTQGALRSMQLHVQSALQAQHPLQNQLQKVENTVGTVSARFDQGMENIQSQLATIQQQIKAVQNSSVVHSTTKAAMEKVIEPAVVSVMQRAGLIQSIKTLQAKEGMHDQVEHGKVAHNSFKAEMVVSAAEKLLRSLPSETPDGGRDFKTGSGYRFHTDGSNTTIYAPDHTELVRSTGQGNNQQITVSPRLTPESADKLSAIGDKINQDLAPVQQESQSLNQSRGGWKL